MAAARIIVLGSSNTDLVIRSPRLPAPGHTVLGGAFYQAHGGKGANQAVAAARAAREPVAFIAAVGDDAFGRESLAQFAREGLDCRHVKTVAGRPSGVALILVDHQGENLISVASGANLELAPADVDAVSDAFFRDAKVFLTCLESPLETVERGLVRAKQLGLRTILNPAPADAAICRGEALRHVDVITPNEHEAAMLSGVDTTTRDGAVAAARKLQTLGCRACIVTLGAQGCVVVEEEAAWIEPCRVQAVDATAAGDAFNGALAVAWSEGASLADAARWATRAAALSVTRAGAQPSLATRAEIEAFAG